MQGIHTTVTGTMVVRGTRYSICRECLATAPLPVAHIELLLEAMTALQTSYPQAVYTVIDYDVPAGYCEFFDYDLTNRWPQATCCFRFKRSSDKVRRIRFADGTGPVLFDRALLLPRWHEQYSSAYWELRELQRLGVDVVKSERPRASEWEKVAPQGSRFTTSYDSRIDPNLPKVCTLECEGCYLALGKGKASLRHKTAIRRTELSRPFKVLLRDGLLDGGFSVLDYGCGLGEDVEFLKQRGIKALGWDPVYKPVPAPGKADVVNLGYVINVIENPQERIITLCKAFELAERLLVVAAYMANGIATKHTQAVPFGDGVITSRGTFQKLFRQKELRQFIESSLGIKAHAADFGVYYVFKDKTLEDKFLSRSTLPSGSRKNSKAGFIKHIGGRPDPVVIDQLVFDTERLGRLPVEEESKALLIGLRQAGSKSSLEQVIYEMVDGGRLEAAARCRSERLLIRLAAARLSPQGRPLMRELTRPERADVRAFFGSYKKACHKADELLLALGDSEAVDRCCKEFGRGKLLPDALYIHVSLEPKLPLLLRLMVACAREFADREIPENVSVLKLKRTGYGVTFIQTEDFIEVAHPAVIKIAKVKFLERKVITKDFSRSVNPSIYHRKELFVDPEHPYFEEFAKLSQQEEELGLLGKPFIGRRLAWQKLLEEKRVYIKGHRVLAITSKP